MDVTELRGKIATVNATVAKLNEQRVRNQGMRETLEKQRSESIAIYKEKYGVDLDEVDVNAEFQRVMKEKEAEVGLLSEVISCIEGGNYARANQLLGVSSSTEMQRTEEQLSQSIPAINAEQTTVSQVSTTPNQVSTFQQTPASVTPPPVDIPMSGVDSLGVPLVAAPPAFPSENPSQGITPPVRSGLSSVPQTPVGVEGSTLKPAVPTSNAGVGLDLSGLQFNTETVNRAVDFSSILGGNQFTP